MEAAVALNPERFVLELLFASLRTGAALALLPALGGVLIPLRIRIGLSGAIGWLALGTGAAPQVPADLLGLAGMAAIAGELMIGLVAALALHAAFATTLIAGDWLAQAMGLGFATSVDPTTPQAPVLASLFGMLVWALFLGGGGLLMFLELVVRSYQAWPAAGALFRPGALMQVVGWGGLAMATGLLAALPMGAGLLLVNLAIGVAARSAPQLNLFSIGFPLLLLLGLIALPLALPALAGSFSGALLAMQGELAGLLLG